MKATLCGVFLNIQCQVLVLANPRGRRKDYSLISPSLSFSFLGACALPCWEVDLSFPCLWTLWAQSFSHKRGRCGSWCFYLAICTMRFAAFPGASWALKNFHQNNFLKLLKFSLDFCISFFFIVSWVIFILLSWKAACRRKQFKFIVVFFVCFHYVFHLSRLQLFPILNQKSQDGSLFNSENWEGFCFFMGFVQLTCVLCYNGLWL